jgi:chemotaxis protein methyltransferase CheR
MAEVLPARHSAAEERAFAFDDRDFRRVCKLIHAHAGIHLQPHKRDMVYGRLVRRLRAWWNATMKPRPRPSSMR